MFHANSTSCNLLWASDHAKNADHSVRPALFLHLVICSHCYISSDFFLVFSRSYYKIVSSSENYSTILEKLREEGIEFETDNGSELIPINNIEVCL